MDIVSLILMVLGALNWGLLGICQLDAVAWLFGGASNIIARIIYVIIGLAGVWGIVMLCKGPKTRNKE